MKKFNKIFNKIMLENLQDNIYNISKNDLVIEYCNTIINNSNQSGHKSINITSQLFQGNFICQKRYFDCISQAIEDFFVNKFLEIKQTGGDDGLFHGFLELSEIIKHINNDDFKHYRDFNKFLNFLRYMPGELTLQISNESNFYQCPLQFTEDRVILIDDNENLFETNLIIAGNLYNKYLTENLKKLTARTERIKKLKNNILTIDNWGTININTNTFLNDDIKTLDIAVNHEVQHFFRYLIRLNYENWSVLNKFANTPHNDYLDDDIDKQKIFNDINAINYFLSEDEFDTYSSSVIQYLIKIFKKNSPISKSTIQDFLASFYSLLGLKFNKGNVSKYFCDKLQDFKQFDDIKKFFEITYKDSLNSKSQLSIGNKWKILVLRLEKSFLLLLK